ncbi:MAG: TIGR04165 family Cys-rich peptide [Methanothermobacter sp.]
MKSEEMSKKCPECGSQDKNISRRCGGKITDTLYVSHIPQGNVSIIRCSKCGHVFECCEAKPPVEIKKIVV